jgi:hypothetical protein
MDIQNRKAGNVIRGLDTLATIERVSGTPGHLQEATSRNVADFIHWLFEESGSPVFATNSKSWLVGISKEYPNFAESIICEAVSNNKMRIAPAAIRDGLTIFCKEES